LKLVLSGEVILSCDPDIGYLHRGVEKLVEGKRFISIIPFIDRLDYIAPVLQEHAYALAIEKALGVSPPARAVFIRAIFDELTRISSHIMSIGTSTFDLGCLSLFLYCLEEREKIMKIFEEVTGARMHLSYYVPGGVWSDITGESLKDISSFLDGLGGFLLSCEKMAFNNRIFMKRTKDVGVITSDDAKTFGLSGVNLRASGVDYDVRGLGLYGPYDSIGFKSIVLDDGDCYARVKLRFLEIEQSVKLIKECIKSIEHGEFCSISPRDLYVLKLPKGAITYSSVESPRGEFGVHMIVADNQISPARIHFKSPSFAHIQILRKLLIGRRIADVTAILGSIDFIMGCCDR
jgi:NADH-quinone oxidoreductase subunit D